MNKIKIILLLGLFICLLNSTKSVLAETTINCNNTLKSGAKGEQVKILQKELNEVMSCGLSTDGSFGPATKTCVLSFQKKYALSQDASVGPKTCKKLNGEYLQIIDNKKEEQNKEETLSTTITLKHDSKGEQVKILQNMLNKTTHCNLAIDGSFGLKTEWCVKKYQEEHGLDVDGKVGPSTRKSLNSGAPIIKKADFLSITTGVLNVRKEATASSKDIGDVKRNEVYQIIDSKTNSDGTVWYKIEYKTGKFGYIYGKYTEKAKDFILLDISQQNLKLYKNGQIILNVPVVTGDKSENNDTPTGNYEIVKKKLGNWLTGADYNSWVDYWIPFISNKYGFHDADWRSSGQLVNKSTYLTNGSHGCVNMFKEDAKNLYNNIDAGLSVTIVEKVYY